MTAKLNIVVAFPAEARYFLMKYRLNLVQNSSKFPIYSNREKNIHLIVSGMGKVKSAAAVAYLHAFTRALTETVYLNAGIAGALEAKIGEIFLANQIVDLALGKTFYPFMPVWDDLNSGKIITLDKPAKIYPNEGLIELEAAGFHAAALIMVTLEQIQTLKIVSDNSYHPDVNIKANHIFNLFAQNEVAITKLIDWMLALSEKESAINMRSHFYYDELLRNYHFTQYQRHQLQEYLRRWQIILPAKNPLELIGNVKNAKEIMSILDQHMAELWI